MDKARIRLIAPSCAYVAHSMGWSAENMERNVNFVQRSRHLRDASVSLLERAVEVSRNIQSNSNICRRTVNRTGRKTFNPEAISLDPARADQ